jgi:hypothetical protein
MTMNGFRSLMAGLCLLTLLGSPARAQPAPVQPWSAGVTPEKKARATELLARGNELLVQNRYGAALEQYELAILAWDHPAIRANMVICYINLARPVEAYESALLALKYGQAPHDKPEVYAATLNYRKLLEGQIATFDVSCTEVGVRVSLDGQDLLVCPARRKRHLLAGKHQLVARKPAFLTVTHDFTSTGGSTESLQVRMVRLADAARTERPWATWKPWAVAGGGAGLALVGGLLQLLAQSDIDRYDARLADVCAPEGSCAAGAVPGSVSSLKSRAELENGVAIGAMVTGGTVVVTGLVWVLLNRPRTILPDESGFGLRVAPIATPDAAGLSFGGTF